MTLAEVADAAQISRPAARRLLLTLAELGYVHGDNGSYALSPRILALGQTYLSSLSFVDVAQAHMKDLAGGDQRSRGAHHPRRLGDRVRRTSRRAADHELGAGRRQSAPRVRDRRWAGCCSPISRGPSRRRGCAPLRSSPTRRRRRPTSGVLLEILAQVRRQGWSVVDQELEDGLRSVAVPIRDSSGACIAAMASSCHASRVSERDVDPRGAAGGPSDRIADQRSDGVQRRCGGGAPDRRRTRRYGRLSARR